MLPDFKAYYKAIVTTTAQYWQKKKKNTQTHEWNRIQPRKETHINLVNQSLRKEEQKQDNETKILFFTK